MCGEKHTILYISGGFVSPPCRQSGLCPWMGHWEVIWFINDGVRFALLHPKAVCSFWLPLNGAQPWSYKLKPGKFLEQSPSAVSPKYRSFFIRVIIRALVWKEAIERDGRNGNTDFIGMVIMRSQGKRRNKLMGNKLYCKCWSNQTCSKLPAWLSEQQVKGWNWCLSWTATLLWPQHPLLENTGKHTVSFPENWMLWFLNQCYLDAYPYILVLSGSSLQKNVWIHLTSSHQTHPTKHLIWAQPFMDHQLVILHLYCCSLLSRIR